MVLSIEDNSRRAVVMRFSNRGNDNELMGMVLRDAAEVKIRKIVEDRIRDDLEGVVKELTQQFIDEFKPQVETSMYRSADRMLDELNVNITSTIKKEQT
jgi:hypothetical protein